MEAVSPPDSDPKFYTRTKLADGRVYVSEYCFNHGSNALGEKTKVELETRTVTMSFREKKKGFKMFKYEEQARVLKCPKCGIQIQAYQ